MSAASSPFQVPYIIERSQENTHATTLNELIEWLINQLKEGSNVWKFHDGLKSWMREHHHSALVWKEDVLKKHLEDDHDSDEEDDHDSDDDLSEDEYDWTSARIGVVINCIRESSSITQEDLLKSIAETNVFLYKPFLSSTYWFVFCHG